VCARSVCVLVPSRLVVWGHRSRASGGCGDLLAVQHPPPKSVRWDRGYSPSLGIFFTRVFRCISSFVSLNVNPLRYCSYATHRTLGMACRYSRWWSQLTLIVCGAVSPFSQAIPVIGSHPFGRSLKKMKKFATSLKSSGSLTFSYFRRDYAMNIVKSLTAVSVGLTLSLFSSALASASESSQVSPMHDFADASVIEGTKATLSRLDGGVHITVDTVGLTPGHAVTAWFVVFNNPENCSDDECGENDIFNLDADGEFVLNADGTPPMNMDGIESSNISVHHADGLIIDVEGTAQFLGSLVVGDMSEVAFGGGLVDANAAEVHIVLRDHDAAIPGSTDTMVNTLSGGCSVDWPNEPCEDLQFAVFKPAK
jgi:hypothetical protein